MKLSGTGHMAFVSSMAAEKKAQPANDQTLRMAQMNLWNLFDTVDNPDSGDEVLTKEQYKTKLHKIALAIVELGLPDLISVNEIENETVLRDLAAQPELKIIRIRLFSTKNK